MTAILKYRSRNVPLRRRIEIRVQTFARTLTKAAFHVRHGYGPIAAWQKVRVTL